MKRAVPRWSQPLRWWSVLLAVVVFAGLALLVVRARHSAPPPRPVANHAFPTQPPQPAEATVWAVSDGADGGDAAKALAQRIAGSQPDRLLHLGDVVLWPVVVVSGWSDPRGELCVDLWSRTESSAHRSPELEGDRRLERSSGEQETLALDDSESVAGYAFTVSRAG